MTNPIFEMKMGKVRVTPQGMAVREVKAIYSRDPDKDKAWFHKVITYVFMAYSKDSPYFDMLPGERKSMVSKEIFGSVNEFKQLEKDKDVELLIGKICQIQLTAKERLLQGVSEKIEEYLDFLKDTKISKSNHEDVAATIKNSNELLKLRDTIEKQVLEQKKSMQVGGGESKLFEG